MNHKVTVYANDIESDGLDEVRKVVVEVPVRYAIRPLLFARAVRHSLARRNHDHVISFGVGDVGADVLWVNSVHRAWVRSSLRGSGATGLHRFPFLRYLDPKHQVLLQMESKYFTKSDASAVVVVADAVGDDLVKLYGIRPDLLHTIHNGFSPTEFSPGRRLYLRPEARSCLGFQSNDVVALIAANELARKGFDVLVEAQARLADRRLQVLLCGRASLAASDRKRLHRLGIADRVHYAGSSSDMSRMYAAADIFVLPTQYEAFSLAIVEALASGLPVITSRLPGAMDRVTDRVNGRLLDDPRSSRELAAVLSEAMQFEARSRWSEHSASAVEDLTWQKIGDKAADILGSLGQRARDHRVRQ